MKTSFRTLRTLLTLSFSSAGFTAAALPDQIITNRADAQIYAASHVLRVERSVESVPIGQVKVYDLNNNPIEPFVRLSVHQPASGERLLAVVMADKFKFSLPTPKQLVRVNYTAFDAYGPVLVANNQFELVASGNPAAPWKMPDWGNKVYFGLDGTFRFELDANFISIEMYNPETGEVTREFLMPKDVGGKKIFSMPAWWFDRDEYRNGLTTIYGNDEMRQYDNATGSVAGINPITFNPSGTIWNHFMVYDSNVPVVQSYLAVQSWGNTLENPSFEYHPSGAPGSEKSIQLNVRTTEGVNATGVRITEQDIFGNTSTFDGTMLQTPNNGTINVGVKPGNTYYFRFFWPDYVKDRAVRG